MLLKFSKFKFNWKYVLGEITLIFTGITLAAWFNGNINERNQRNEEKQVAIILQQDLNEDLQALDFDIMILGHEINRLEKLESWCGNSNPSLPFDSVKFALTCLAKEEWKEINNNGYNLLLHNGTELIQSEKLREKIFHYYSQATSTINKMETSGNMMVGENIKYITEHFKSFDFAYGKIIEPVDSVALRADPKLKILVQDFIMRRTNNQAIYQDYLRPKLTELLELIKKEYPTK